MDEMPAFYSYSSSEVEYSIVVDLNKLNTGEIKDDMYTNIIDTENLFIFITPEDVGEEKIYVEKFGEIEIYYREK